MRILLVFSLLCAAACGVREPPPEGDLNTQIEVAIRKHLARRDDLDMSKMDLTIQNVSIQGETAEATVGFQVKDAPEAAMSMRYRLVKEAGGWVVQSNGGGQEQELPPGHPPAGGARPAQPLPPGHPPVAQ